MKYQNLRKKTEGFTIIEVLIVLAIAGLIMLIVFLAVPALQRNQRNNARSSEASRVAAALTDWAANNQGRVFTAGTGNANLTSVANAVGATNQLTLTAGTSFTVATGNQAGVTTDVVRVVTGAQCGDNGATVANTGSNGRLSAVQYATLAGGNTFQGACIDV